jgi:penicillin-binding protein 1A
VAALPIFIEFMKEALKGMPRMDFKAPPDAKLAYVGPNREAFRPGTEPKIMPLAAPTGADAAAAIAPVTPGSAPPATAPPTGKPVKPSKAGDHLTGLY